MAKVSREVRVKICTHELCVCVREREIEDVGMAWLRGYEEGEREAEKGKNTDAALAVAVTDDKSRKDI